MIESPDVTTLPPGNERPMPGERPSWAKPTGRIIWDTMLALRENGQAISRQRIMELSGLTYTKVDDHVSRWIDNGRLRRVVDGVYELVEAMPEPRAVSVTDLHNGQTMIECGDQVVHLWPAEVRALGLRLVGSAMQFAQLQTQHDMAALLAEATTRNRALADRVHDLELEQKLDKQGQALLKTRRRAGNVPGGGVCQGE
ncbi:MAG: hypothetical protein QM740_18035 [Acidovorax sp.]